MTDKIAVMLCGQCSRDATATEEFNLLASELRHRLTDYDIESGFLEAAAPRVREGLDTLAERNAREQSASPACYSRNRSQRTSLRKSTSFPARMPD